MNKQVNKSIRTGLVAVASILACYACSDTWDEHYEPVVTNSTIVNQTLYQQMKSQQNLSDFIEIIDAAGYKPLLDECQLVTVFAPVNATAENPWPVSKADIIAGLKNGGEERQIQLMRFVKNHIARFNYSATKDSVSFPLLNKKMSNIVGNKVSNDKIQILKENTICNNGVLHVIAEPLQFHANIYETLETAEGLDSLYSFIHYYDEDSLDVNRSVYHGVNEDGERIYVDSVIISNNDLLRRLDSYIFREDSNYIAIVPTNNAYVKRLNEIKEYFVFNIHEDDRDSLQNFFANYFLLNTLFYNKNTNIHKEDSIMSTAYGRWNPDHFVFYKPFEKGGILSPEKYTKKFECSNGTIYQVDEIPTTIEDAFFHRIELECENTGRLNTDEDAKGTTGVYTKGCTYSSVLTDDKKVSGKCYLDVRPASTSSQPYIAYTIPNTLSGEYDMYLVTVPMKMGRGIAETDSLKPYQFRVNMYYRTNRATETTSTWPSNKNKTLTNPVAGGQNFLSDPEKIDTIFLGTEKFTECYYNRNNPGVMLQIQAYVSSSQTKTYSRRMLLDKIILVPKGQSPRNDHNRKELRNEELNPTPVVPTDPTDEPTEEPEEN